MDMAIKFLLLAVFVVSWVQAKSVDYQTNTDDCGQLTERKLWIGTNQCFHPWAVLVRNDETGAYCTGALINFKHVISSSSCVHSRWTYLKAGRVVTHHSQIFVYYQTTLESGLWVSVKKIIPIMNRNFQCDTQLSSRYCKKNSKQRHPYLWDIRNVITIDDEDLAILRLEEPIPPGNCTRQICVPRTWMLAEDGYECEAYGWDLTQDPYFFEIAQHQTMMPYQECFYMHTDFTYFMGKFCTIGKETDPCMKHVGRALVCKNENGRYCLMGLNNYDIDYKCGSNISIYTRLSQSFLFIDGDSFEKVYLD